MKQVYDFCEGNIIFCTLTLSLKERLKLLFKGTLVAEVKQDITCPTGSAACYYMPKIFKIPRRKKENDNAKL